MRALLLLLSLSTALLQAAAQKPPTTAVDVLLGIGSMVTGTAHVGSPTGLAVDVLLSTERERNRGARIFAIGIGVQGAGASSLVCRDNGQGGCIPGHPDVTSIAAMLGWQSANAKLRLLAGPALAYLDNAGVGAHVRADVALPMTRRLAFVSYARVHSYAVRNASPYHLFGAGVGLRIAGSR